MKKLAKLIVFLVLGVFMMTACKSDVEDVITDNPPKDETEEKTYKFAYSCITLDNPFFISLETSLRATIEEAGHTLITEDAKSDAELQHEQIMELIEKDVDAVFISPVDWKKITPAVQALKDEGIKVINVDTQMQDFDLVDAYVGSDNNNAGYLIGMDLIEKFPEGGEILIVECPNRNSINERIKGFEKAISGKGFQVIKRIDGQGDLDVALPKVEEALKENPNIVAVMCGNDPMALGAVVAANTVKKSDILIYGIDGSPEVKKELVKENSILTATIGQSTVKMGKEAANVGIKIMNEQQYERVIYIETFFIDKDNVQEYGVESWQ